MVKAHYVFVGKCPYEIRNINYKPIKMQIIIACDDTHLHSQNLEGRSRGITLSFRVRLHQKKKNPKGKNTQREVFSAKCWLLFSTMVGRALGQPLGMTTPYTLSEGLRSPSSV